MNAQSLEASQCICNWAVWSREQKSADAWTEHQLHGFKGCVQINAMYS